MSIRFKLVAAALGLVVASGAVADASAKTITKTVAHRTIVAKKTIKVFGHPAHRVFLGSHFGKRITIVHRAPARVKVVKVLGPKAHVTKIVRTKKIVRLGKAPLRHHAMNRVVSKTVIR